MTATPRVFGEEARRKAAEADAVLADMNDEAVYGPELHRLGFGDAVEADLLTDYKVVVLAVDEQYVAENFQHAMATSGEIALGDAAKLLGCWNGLAKHFVDPAEREADPAPMRRAVAFAKDIKRLQAGHPRPSRCWSTAPSTATRRGRPPAGEDRGSRPCTSTARWASRSATSTSPGSRPTPRTTPAGC